MNAILGAALVAVSRNDPRMVLLGKRKKEDGHGLWVLVGGRVDDGERPDHAVLREVEEEIGVKLEKATPLYHDYIVRRDRGDCFMLYYYAEVSPQNVSICAEHEFSELGWFDVYDLPAEMWSTDRAAVKRYAYMNWGR